MRSLRPRHDAAGWSMASIPELQSLFPVEASRPAPLPRRIWKKASALAGAYRTDGKADAWRHERKRAERAKRRKPR